MYDWTDLVLGSHSERRSPICALAENSPRDCFRLRCALTLTSWHARLQIPHSTLIKSKTPAPRGYRCYYYGVEWGIWTLGTRKVHSISSAAPSATRTTLHVVELNVHFQLLNYYIQFCEKNQVFFEKCLSFHKLHRTMLLILLSRP